MQNKYCRIALELSQKPFGTSLGQSHGFLFSTTTYASKGFVGFLPLEALALKRKFLTNCHSFSFNHTYLDQMHTRKVIEDYKGLGNESKNPHLNPNLCKEHYIC